MSRGWLGRGKLNKVTVGKDGTYEPAMYVWMSLLVEPIHLSVGSLVTQSMSLLASSVEPISEGVDG